MKAKKNTKKVECVFCHKPFHPKGIYSHQAKCNERFINAQTVAPERCFTVGDMQRERELGRKEGEERNKQRFTDVQIKALEAASHAVEAIAHMVGDLR